MKIETANLLAFLCLNAVRSAAEAENVNKRNLSTFTEMEVSLEEEVPIDEDTIEEGKDRELTMSKYERRKKKRQERKKLRGKKYQPALSTAIEVMTQRDEGADKPSTCYNLLEQHWTLLMDYRTVGMVGTGMLVDFPKGEGMKPGPHVHCGLSETFVAIKPEEGPGSKARAYWMFERDGLNYEHAVEDGDVLAAPLGRMHTYYTRTPGAANIKEEIPLVDPELWSRHLVIKIQGMNHQLRAESTGIIEGACEPRLNNIGSDLAVNGGRTFTKNFDLGDPGFISRMAALNGVPVPLYAPPNKLVVDSQKAKSDDVTPCPGLVGVTGSKAMIDMEDLEGAYSLVKCYMDPTDPSESSSGDVAIPDVGYAIFMFIRKGYLTISTGSGEKTAKNLDGVTIPTNSGGYKAACIDDYGCEVWFFKLNTQLNIALSPHFGVDASRKVRVEQSDYGKKNYDSYQTCRGEYKGTVYEGGSTINVPITVDGSTGKLLEI